MLSASTTSIGCCATGRRAERRARRSTAPAAGRVRGRRAGKRSHDARSSHRRLALFWAGVIAVAILVYVILDGFDLGVGILFGTHATTERCATQMMATIAPFWDGNETWLVVVGASLFAAFPVVYAVFLPAFYIPVLLLLFGLIFRGVAFEFRYRGGPRGCGTADSFSARRVAAFVQGAAVGAMIRGIPVTNGQYAGGAFDWLAPLPVLCGIGLVLGYALLGAGWLVLKSEGALRDWATGAFPGAVAIVVLVRAWRPRIDDLCELQWRTRQLGPPALGAGLSRARPAGDARRLPRRAPRRDAWPFVMTRHVLPVAAFPTLAVLFWPYMIPYRSPSPMPRHRTHRCPSCSGAPGSLCYRWSPSTPGGLLGVPRQAAAALLKPNIDY